MQQLALQHPYSDFRQRGQWLLLLGSGLPVKGVAQQLDVSLKSVYNWVHWWKSKGLCGLLVGHKGGRPRVLSDDLITTAVEVARAELLGLREIAQRIEAVHGSLPCCLETLLSPSSELASLTNEAATRLKKTRPRGFCRKSGHALDEYRKKSSIELEE